MVKKSPNFVKTEVSDCVDRTFGQVVCCLAYAQFVGM